MQVSAIFVIYFLIKHCVIVFSDLNSASTMPSVVEDGLDNEIEAPEPPTLSGPIIGIIYPPPEVRSEFNLETFSIVLLFQLSKNLIRLVKFRVVPFVSKCKQKFFSIRRYC